MHELFLGGRLSLRLPDRGAGYRTNVDALLACREALQHAPRAHVLDLGAGTGVIGLSLHVLGAAGNVTLVEKDPAAARLAQENARPFARVRVLESDVAQLQLSAPADLVVCNPPYTPPDHGIPAPEPRRAQARQGDVAPFLAAARRHLRDPESCAVFVYPVVRLVELLHRADRAGLYPVALRFVHARRGDANARIALVTFRMVSQPLTVRPPWYEWAGTQREPALASFLAGEPLAL